VEMLADHIMRLWALGTEAARVHESSCCCWWFPSRDPSSSMSSPVLTHRHILLSFPPVTIVPPAGPAMSMAVTVESCPPERRPAGEPVRTDQRRTELLEEEEEEGEAWGRDLQDVAHTGCGRVVVV